MKKFFITLFVSLLVFIGYNTLKNVPAYDPYSWTKHKLIAHAGGGIDDKIYTNSLDAFKENYQKGFRLFEFDIAITSDNKLVARHGWEDDIGQGLKNKGPLKYQEFMNTLYYDQYQPMDFEMILELLEKHPDLFVILDGKVTSPEDVEILYKRIGEVVEGINNEVLSRIIPQMFYKSDLEIIRQYGFHDVLYVVGREDYTPDSLAEFCVQNDIGVVSLSAGRTNEEIVQMLNGKGIKSYTYTLNDIEEMSSFLEIGVNGFFTDFIIDLEQTAR